MAQGYDKYELDNQTGQSFRFALNDILEAVATQNSGDNSPNTTNTSYPYQTWVDTTNDVVKIRDAATAGTWYSLYSVDANGQPTGAVATGSYSISTNDTGGTGGTTAIFVDTSQNVGIGNAIPIYTLDVNGPIRSDGTSGGLYFGGNSTTPAVGSAIHRPAADTLAFVTASIEGARIDSSGRLLVGTTTSLRSSAFIQSRRSSGANETWHQSDSLGNGNFCRGIFVSGSRSGQIGVFKHSGITNPAGMLYLQEEDGSDSWFWTDNSGNLRISSLDTNIGTTGGTVVGTQTSDERLKNVGENVVYGLAEVLQLQPKQYALKTEPDTNKLGFIAQEVESIIPEAVFDTSEELEGHQEGDRTKLGMEYVQLIPVLVNAIKEQQAMIETLEAKVAALEAQ